ncbi:alpha/beta hydrolase [Agrococcus jejuensis]|uniref:Alpha/beta hydrolase family protein n=1 Tax=Agrococcus jejuensis TaxID=399736 RepID=A0A1G8AR26_9MICO|nr:alpha/beta hydrolase [Agrococcus jejuensis]SDH23333.1 Alpha/beta hydrolase family protein [Agrococcus jejuensis]
MADESGAPPRRRRRRVVRIVGIAVAGVLVLAIVGGLVWAGTPYRAEAAGLAAAEADARITVADEGDVVVLSPAAEASTTLEGQGIVFFAGARVDAAAYVATFRDVAAAGATVVLVRPILNLAIVELRPLSTFTDAVPGVESWSVGGHSMGGVRACTYAEDDAVQALVLLASYCSLGDLSGRDDLTVLSITGSRDGVLRQDAADEARDLLPDDAVFVELEGVNHAQFGDYGAQPGDDEATVAGDEAHAEIAATIVDALDG